MKTDDEIKAEFEAWWNKQPVPNPDAYFDYDCTHKQCGYEAYKACQRLNDKVISAKDAEIARLKECLDFANSQLAGVSVWVRDEK